jgi:hypothetical protein
LAAAHDRWSPDPATLLRRVVPPHRWLSWGLVVLAVGSWFWAIVNRQRFDSVTVAFTLLIGAVALFAARMARSRVDVFPTGLVVCNPLSSFAARWENMDAVDTAPYLGYMRTARVRVDGRWRPLFAVHGIANSWEGKGGGADVELRQLRERVARRA